MSEESKPVNWVEAKKKLENRLETLNKMRDTFKILIANNHQQFKLCIMSGASKTEKESTIKFLDTQREEFIKSQNLIFELIQETDLKLDLFVPFTAVFGSNTMNKE